MPIQLPLIIIFTLLYKSFVLPLNSSNDWLNGSIISYNGNKSDVIVMCAKYERFFTTPTLWPSGLSAGQINPHCVLCNFLGGINLPLLSIGVLILRKWLKLEIYVNLFRTWATPTLLLLICLIPKSPVANALFIPFSIVVDLTIL